MVRLQPGDGFEVFFKYGIVSERNTVIRIRYLASNMFEKGANNGILICCRHQGEYVIWKVDGTGSAALFLAIFEVQYNSIYPSSYLPDKQLLSASILHSISCQYPDITSHPSRPSVACLP